MIRSRILPVLVFFLCLGMLASDVALSRTEAHWEELPPSLARELRLSGVPASAVGIYVRDVTASDPVLAYGADQAMNPASTMKLVTTFAALDVLGPAYVWKTEVYTEGEVKEGVLQGNLVVKGYGNPKLTLENFWLLLRSLRQRGVMDIRGDLVLDRSYFAPGDYDPAAFDDRPYRPYNVGPDALLLNYKSIGLQFIPDRSTGGVRIVADPPVAQLNVVNEVRLTQDGCNDWDSGLEVVVVNNPERTMVTIGGVYPEGCGEKAYQISLFDHGQYFYQVFRQMWEELGGALEGQWRNGEVPPGARHLVSAESPTLAEVLRDINKLSNNVMARQLFLTLGAEAALPPATPARSFMAVKRWLEDNHLDFPELVMENGSGLSRNERISPRHLGELLVLAARSPLMPEFIASLPLAAVDGTMKRRFRDLPVAGRAHLKTGYLGNVRATAGYVLDREGRMMVVVCLINHSQSSATRGLHDALVDWVYSGSRMEQGHECCGRPGL